MPLITYPTRITSKTKTLIDNIFYNQFSSDIVSGNLTIGISDHMPQFALIPNNPTRVNPKIQQQPKYARKYKNINTGIFCQDIDNINWDTNELDIDQYGDKEVAYI